MPWNKNTGGGRWQPGGGQGGPWGQQPSGGSGGGRGGDQPPDLEELLRRSRERLRRLLPGGLGGSFMVLILGFAFVAIWLASGFYLVHANEKGVVQRFGKFVRTAEPGLQYHLPWPIETASTPPILSIERIEIGVSAGDAAQRAANDDNLMLTGDRNLLDVAFTVQWQIKDGPAYLFNVSEPNSAIRQVAESAMREVIGKGEFDQLQTELRGATEEQVKTLIQQTLDTYGAGILVTEVNVQKVDPPQRALEAARDVESAKQEKETLRNQAQAYQDRIIPEARGLAERLLQEAQGYKQRVVAESEGQASRFNAIYEEYRKAPEVTRRRMYLETMERVLSGTNKVIIDQRAGSGVVPYLPLPELQKSRPANGQPAAKDGGAQSSAQGGN